jgi:hypothetical protein
VNVPSLAAIALADQVERIGSYFGFAAVIGLAVLSLLYFSQAREVKRLREWAGRSPERDAELAQRVQADAQRRVVAQPVTASRPAPQPASPQTAAAVQADAARKAAAAAVMEKFQQPGGAGTPPVLGPPGQLDRPAAAATDATTAPEAGSAPGATDKPDAPAAGSGDAPATTSPPVTSAPTAASAGAAAAAAATRQSGPPARSPAFANGAGGQDTHESAAARPDPLAGLPPRPPRTTPAVSSRHDEQASAKRRPRLGMIAGGSAAAIAVVVVLVLLLTGGSDTPPVDNEIGGSGPPPAASKPTSAATKIDRKATQIAVLNGTTQTGLARNVGNRLEGSGFTILTVGDNADQQIATTTISYVDGAEKAARVVAQLMDVPAASVRPIDTNTAAAVRPEAKVVVVVGSDRSSTG